MSAAARRISTQVRVGDVAIGGGAPIVVQSMTNTDTADAEATARQVAELWRAGSELVRITVNTPEAAAQVAGGTDEETGGAGGRAGEHSHLDAGLGLRALDKGERGDGCGAQRCRERGGESSVHVVLPRWVSNRIR